MPWRAAFFGELYDRSMRGTVPRGSEQVDVDAFLRAVRPRTGSRVLDLACAWGRHLALLRAARLRPVGLELSAAYLAHAGRRSRLVRADMRALPFAAGSFAAVSSFFTSLFYFDRRTHRRMLADIARVLQPGGALYLDLQNPHFLQHKQRPRHVRQLRDGTWLSEQGDFRRGVDSLDVELLLPDGQILRGGYRARCYRLGELTELLASAGLSVRRVMGSPAGERFVEKTSEDMLVVARKVAS